MIDVDEFDILLGIFKSWRENNPEYAEATAVDGVEGYYELGFAEVFFDMSVVGNGRYVTDLGIFLFGGRADAPDKIALGELGKLKRLEDLTIAAYDHHLELVGQLPFEKLTTLKKLELNFFGLDKTEHYSDESDFDESDTECHSHPIHPTRFRKFRTFPRNGLPADKLIGIGKLSCLEILHIAGVKSGFDSSILSEICGLKNLKVLKFVNCDSESEAWLPPIEEEHVLALLHVTRQLPPDIQGKILEDLSIIPHPIQVSFKKEGDDIIEGPGAYIFESHAFIKDNGLGECTFCSPRGECECEDRLLQARKIFPKLQEFGAKYFVEEYRTLNRYINRDDCDYGDCDYNCYCGG